MLLEQWQKTYQHAGPFETDVKREYSLEKLLVEQRSLEKDVTLEEAEAYLRRKKQIFTAPSHVCNKGKGFAILPLTQGMWQLQTLAADVLRDFALSPALYVKLPLLTYVDELVYTAWHDVSTANESYQGMRKQVEKRTQNFQLNSAILAPRGKYWQLTFHFGYRPNSKRAEGKMKEYEAELKKVFKNTARIRKIKQENSPFV